VKTVGMCELSAHARNRITPVAVARGPAEGAHLERIGRTGDEGRDRHRPRAGEEAGVTAACTDFSFYLHFLLKSDNYV
jgi:hypothetical protein